VASVAVGVVRQHLAYEASLIDAAMARLGPADVPAAASVRDAVTRPDEALRQAMVAGHLTDAGSRAAWDAAVGTGAPRPGEPTHYFCSVGARQSDAQDLESTPPSGLAEELASIELGLLVEGRQLSGALTGDLRASVDQSQRSALHALAPMLIPTDRDFAIHA
jgi:hypothetical protein